MGINLHIHETEAHFDYPKGFWRVDIRDNVFGTTKEEAERKADSRLKLYREAQQTLGELQKKDRQIKGLEAILNNPEKWMKWCDIKVLEKCEELQAKLKGVREKIKQHRDCDCVRQPVCNCVVEIIAILGGEEKITEQIKKADDLILELLCQGCIRPKADQIDNMCLSTYEAACDYLADKGMLKNINNRIYEILSTRTD